MDKGYAYEAGGNIYFDTSKLKEYYVFHNFNEEDLEVGVREGVEEDTNKRNKADFVLWFTKSKFDDQELKWDSPWGVGYPGWHIECSAMSNRYLGKTIDIHCGGQDLIFPHHENEIAQSECCTGKEYAHYWMHNGYINVDNKKMSKSLGNCIYLADSPADIKTKIMSMFTDPLHIQVSDPGHIEGNTVFTYLDAFCTDEHFERYLPDYKNLDELKEHYKRGGLGDMKIKKFLNNVMQEELEPIRLRREELAKNMDYVYDVLKKGTEKARQCAAQTMSEVKKAMKIDYFG